MKKIGVLKTVTFIEGGIEFTIPSYMESQKKEFVDFTFKKLRSRLEDSLCRDYGEEPRDTPLQ
jgi:hypothetical protein